jgi:hypothetical protein
MAKKVKRVFHGKRKGVPFEIETTLTNAAAIKILGKIPGEFAEDCAYEITLLEGGHTAKPSLVAWGFRLAKEGPPAAAGPVQLSAGVLARVMCRKPLKALTPAGNPVLVRLCGDRSKHVGKYAITNGGDYGSDAAAFYGYASPAGKWTPTRMTPEGVVEFLKTF